MSLITSFKLFLLTLAFHSIKCQSQGPQFQGPQQRQPDFQSSVPAFLRNYFNVFITPPWTWNNGNPTGMPQIFNWFNQIYKDNLTQIATKCHPRSVFASFNPLHRSAVEDLVSMFEERNNLKSFMEFSQFAKSRPEVHPHVWYAAFLKAQQRMSPDTLMSYRPSALELFPSEFFPDIVVQVANQFRSEQSNQYQRGKRQSGPQCVMIDERIGQDNGQENLLWYFREDIQLNGHHFIWHLLYPTAAGNPGPIPRRGELFYFFHHDLLARYTTERMTNGLSPQSTVPLFLDENTVINEGYNPHLTDSIASQPWAPRAPNTPLNGNTLARRMVDSLQNVVVLRQRIIDLLNTGRINVDGRYYQLSPSDNINNLGELIEASVFSMNPSFYGQPGLHNDVHWIIANLDLGNFPVGTLGVMGHSATAMRDIVFYRVHQGIDILFSTYKDIFLPPYALTTGDHNLVFDGIQLNSITVNSVSQGASPNELGTFWNTRRFNLQGGFDFNPANVNGAPNVDVCAKHLDHEEFVYQIQVNNNRNSVTNAFVRIFMAPRYKSTTSQERYTFEEQRKLFFAMDSFVQILQPGQNIITRRSQDSTLTVPWPRSIQDLRQDVESGRNRVVNCECGFPHHLLLPKGTEEGMVFDLFVMLTDASVDLINDGSAQSQFGTQCIPSHVHCGIIGQIYPDAKPLGYPFDRRSGLPVQVRDANGNVVVQNMPPPNLEAYVGSVINMNTAQITITHRNIQVGI